MLLRGKMKKVAMALLVLALLCGAAAAAKDAPAISFSKIGVGIILGDPIGFSGKFWLNDENAVDAAFTFFSSAKLQLQADYVWHKYNLIEAKGTTDRIAVYYGPGALVRIALDDSFVIGGRGTIGITCIFKNAPFDTFIELSPSLFFTAAFQLTLL